MRRSARLSCKCPLTQARVCVCVSVKLEDVAEGRGSAGFACCVHLLHVFCCGSSSVAVLSVTGEVGPLDWVMLPQQKPWQQKCGETDETSCGRVRSPGPWSLLQLLHLGFPFSAPPHLRGSEAWRHLGREPATSSAANAMNWLADSLSQNLKHLKMNKK